MSQVIPEGWVKASLSEVVAVNPKHKDLEDQVAGFVPMALAPTDFNGTLGYEERQWDKIKKGYTHFATGDVIFAKVTPCFENGKAAVVKELPNDIGAGSTEFYVLRPAIKDISVNYIFSVIKSYEFLQTGAENMTGAVGLRRVPKKFVEDFKINLPPLAEQKAIADKLDELLAQVESTKARLDAIPTIIKSFRQSVLAAAVSGKLTKEWRGDEQLNWKAIKLEDAAGIIDPQPSHRTPKAVEGGVPYIGIGDLKSDGSIDFENARKVSMDVLKEHNARYQLKKGDFVFGKIGTLGKATILPTDIDYTLSANVILIQPKISLVDASYLMHFLSAPSTMEEVARQSNSTSQAAFGIKKMRAFKCLLPSLEEQTEIVHRVEELFAFADKIEAQVNAAQTRVNNLTQSILAKAFRGELTADWRAANPELISGENSAQALLERIKAEREALALAAKAAKKKPRVRKAKA